MYVAFASRRKLPSLGVSFSASPVCLRQELYGFPPDGLTAPLTILYASSERVRSREDSSSSGSTLPDTETSASSTSDLIWSLFKTPGIQSCQGSILALAVKVT